MTQLPKDPAMLLSYINTQLRDFYPSMNELCEALSVSKEEIDRTLASMDYRSEEDRNQYV